MRFRKRTSEILKSGEGESSEGKKGHEEI